MSPCFHVYLTLSPFKLWLIEKFLKSDVQAWLSIKLYCFTCSSEDIVYTCLLYMYMLSLDSMRILYMFIFLSYITRFPMETLISLKEISEAKNNHSQVLLELKKLRSQKNCSHYGEKSKKCG